MYVTQDIADRIKLTAKRKKIKMSELLSYCELNINAVSEFSKGKQLSCISFAKIADYLDCSTDYLLGRTNVPTINGNTQFNGENHNGIQATVNTGNLTVNENARSYADTDELVNLVKSLPIVERAKAIIYLNELKTKTSPISGEE